MTPGLTFEQQNKRLYESSINAQLDEIFDAAVAPRGSSDADQDEDEGEGEGGSSSSSSGTVNVPKSAKVAAWLMLGLLMPAARV